ncbi:MAG: DUF4390 domain-containing protein [Betaproteobacteria bacterium]|jgi:hypothetical protein|nr:DUF4390 domain-containing protein [Betaproteobacteria bacterium]
MMALTQVMLIIAMLMPGLVARANETESVRLSRPVLSLAAENAWTIDADVQVTLNSVLIDALKRGVPLVFSAEFEILKKRWYWFNERLLSQSRPLRLSFHSVTQQYRVSQGEQLLLMTANLDEALAATLNVRQWQVVPGAAELPIQDLMQQVVKAPDAYEIRFRTRLDSSQLPKPLQLNALTNRDWNLSTEWVRPQLSLSGPGSTQ